MSTGMKTSMKEDSRPLCVDLDGALLTGDLLWESIVTLVRRHPASLLEILAWLMSGRAHTKEQVARRITPDVQCLPYSQSLLVFLMRMKEEGRSLVLVTGSDTPLATRSPITSGFSIMSLRATQALMRRVRNSKSLKSDSARRGSITSVIR